MRAGRPLHGPNQFPHRPAALRDAVLEYIDALTTLGPDDHARPRARPRPGTRLVRGRPHRRPRRAVPHLPLPAGRARARRGWGVGEHTDYGLLTMLMQDGVGGLQVRTSQGWVDVPPDPERHRVQRGRHVRTIDAWPVRVDATPGSQRPELGTGCRSRSSSTRAGMRRCARSPTSRSGPTAPIYCASRWDGGNVHALTGTYGEYLLAKVSKVFPGPRRRRPPRRTEEPRDRDMTIRCRSSSARSPTASSSRRRSRPCSRETIRRTRPLADENARRLGISRRQFLGERDRRGHRCSSCSPRARTRRRRARASRRAAPSTSRRTRRSTTAPRSTRSAATSSSSTCRRTT